MSKSTAALVPENISRMIARPYVMGDHDPLFFEAVKNFLAQGDRESVTALVALIDEVQWQRFHGQPQLLAMRVGLSTTLGKTVSANIRSAACDPNTRTALRAAYAIVLAMGFQGDLGRVGGANSEVAMLYHRLAHGLEVRPEPVTLPPELEPVQTSRLTAHVMRLVAAGLVALALALTALAARLATGAMGGAP